MSHQDAVADFRDARREAFREQFMARLTGRSANLLSFNRVREQLKATAGIDVGLRDIPLDCIVGSVGRYQDFTRSFLPRMDADRDRWARVQTAAADLQGLPPIDVYQIGEVYFVRDGNHRVSVARRLGAPTIQARVTVIDARVPLTPDVQPDELFLKAEYADFLERTHLDEARPGADLTVTASLRYPEFLEHIDVHRYYMGLDYRRDIAYGEAVGHWYDEVYMPVVRVIRDAHVLDDFPGRTEADLYLWLSRHRAELEEMLGWHIETPRAAADLAAQFGRTPQRRLARAGRALAAALTPHEFEDGPPTGAWRRERRATYRPDRMFPVILAAVSGQETGWAAVSQAVEVARREGARLLGLHVVRTAAERHGEAVHAVEAEFELRCAQGRVEGRLAVQPGPIARTICERSRWADLAVVALAHPPDRRPVARLASGFRTLVRCCATPMLAVPGDASSMERPLLAYDGSPTAREALFVAAYLAARGPVPLVVVTVHNSMMEESEPLAQACAYLQARGVQCTPVQATGVPGDAILTAAQAHRADLILMGSYGHKPLLEAVLGSTVDPVLRQSEVPVLICP